MQVQDGDLMRSKPQTLKYFFLSLVGLLLFTKYGIGEIIEIPPIPDNISKKIKPSVINYEVSYHLENRSFKAYNTREISQTQIDGKNAWHVSKKSEGSWGTSFYLYDLDLITLLPLKCEIATTSKMATLEYTGNNIQGTITSREGEVALDLKLDGPVLADDVALDLFVENLPLTPEYEAKLRVFDIQQEEVKQVSLKVVGSENITIGSNTIDTFKVELKSLTNNKDINIYHISKGETRKVISRKYVYLLSSGTQIPVTQKMTYKTIDDYWDENATQ